jgi:protein-S-isoprenylcysteine O-methyltransferase Ste14
MMMIPIWYVFGLWALWILQFALLRTTQKSTPVKTAPKARWGIVLQGLGYWVILVSARSSWTAPISVWRLSVGITLGMGGIWLASTGVRHLGKQWRVNAALNADHELVTSGPYQIVRHPIYASMLAMNIMIAILLGRLPWWPIGVVLFLVGIEIRVRVEDGLLRERFGPRFEAWRLCVPAYLPLIR